MNSIRFVIVVKICENSETYEIDEKEQNRSGIDERDSE